MQISGVTSSEAPPPGGKVETLSSLCRWWGDTKEEPLPSICHQFVSPDRLLDHPWATVQHQLYTHHQQPLLRHPPPSSSDLIATPFGTGRSISLIGILGGVLFILLIVAFITCLRRRKRWHGGSRDPEAELGQQLQQLHQLRSSHQLLQAREAPPDYTTVCKQKEEEEGGLPSYSQAVEEEQRRGEGQG